MAVTTPGNRMLTPQQGAKAQQGFKNVQATGVSSPTQSSFKTPTGYTRVSPGMYRDASGRLVKQNQIPTQAPVAKTPVTPTTPPVVKKTAPPAPTTPGGAGTTNIGTTPTTGVQQPTVTPGAVPPPPTLPPTEIAPPTPPTMPPEPPTSYEDYMKQFGATEPPSEPASMLPPELWQQVLGILRGPQPEAPTTNLPTQEALGQLFQQRYQQELADLTAGTEERQRKEQLRREQDLINRGISPDSEAYRQEQRALAESRALESAQTRQQARAFAEQGVTSEYNRALAAAQEQRAAFEQAQGARYRPLETLAPIVQTQAQLEQNRWATKYQADVQRDLNAMNLASDEKKFFANLGQQDRQFFETLIREDRKFAADQAQWDKTFKESIRQFEANLKVTNKKIEADIRNDKNLTKIQRDQLIELTRSNRAQEANEARRIAAINRGDTKTAADIEANQNAVVQGQIKGYYEAIFPLVGVERAKEMVQDRFGAGGGGIDIGR